MNKILRTLLAVAVLIAVCASPVRGAAIVNATEVGGNVVFAGGGTFDLTGLFFSGQAGQGATIDATFPFATFGANPATFILIDNYNGMNSPGPIGPGGAVNPFADLGTGDRFGFFDTFLIVPTGYSSGSLLSASNTYFGMTFASLGITPGTYPWTWGSGPNADSFTLNIVAPAVPESGSTALSMFIALGALALLGRSGWLVRAS